MSKNTHYLFSSQFFSMSKRQKLSEPDAQFEGLPDEVILKILGYLKGTRGLIYCGHLSRRIRAISQDETLWQKINLSRQNIPTGFLQMVLNNGCKYLTLRSSYIHGILKLNRPTQLQYLDLTKTKSSSDEVLDELLGSCYSLQKLSVKHSKISLVNKICQQNWKSLKVLNFEKRGLESLDMESIKLAVKSCAEIKELNLAGIDLSEDAINVLVNNLTPKIEKLNLSWIGRFWLRPGGVNDEQIKTLVDRCKKITSLNLRNCAISDNSITSIIGNLQSLEELDVTRCKKLSYNKLLELKLLPKLKLLNCLDAGDYDYRGMETKLKREMPYLIFSKYLEFANTRNSGNFIHDGIWEIKADHFQLFREPGEPLH